MNLRPSWSARRRHAAICVGLLSLPVLASSSFRDALAYDAKAPLNVREERTEKRGDVLIRSVRFAGSSATDEQGATIVTPAGPGPFAGVLFVHWLGDPETTNRTEFLDEAIGLAGHGAISVLVDAMWSEPKWWDHHSFATDYAHSIQQVINLRRGMDLLWSQPHLDPKRVAYVGHDFGAMYGVLMGTVDARPKTYVLLAGTPEFSDWYFLDKAPVDKPAYLKQMSPLDPARNIASLAPASVFFQFASSDHYVPATKADAFFQAAKEPKLTRTYDTTHKMESRLGTSDRFRWLTKELALKKD